MHATCQYSHATTTYKSDCAERTYPIPDLFGCRFRILLDSWLLGWLGSEGEARGRVEEFRTTISSLTYVCFSDSLVGAGHWWCKMH